MQENGAKDVICEDLWYEDGSVVISASVDASRHLFKVHKSVLSSHSHVLRDLFTLPQPLAEGQSKDSDTYDGLPLVVFPDAPDDVRDLLSALYNPTKLVCRRNRRSTFKTIAGVLRLSTKYEVTVLCKHIIEVLEEDFPSSFEAWEANDLAIEKILTARDGAPPSSPEIIQLAMECGITTILPAAFYNIARIAYIDDTPSELQTLCYRDGQMKECSQDVSQRIIAGRLGLRSHAYDIYSGSVRCVSANCALPKGDKRTKCHSTLKEWWTNNACECLFLMEDVLGTLRLLIGRMEKTLPNEVCLKCRENLEGSMRDDQKEIWGLLPTYFELDSTGGRTDSDSDE